MRIFKPYGYILILMLSTFWGCGETIESTWKDQPILVDGKGDEWSNYPLQYNEDLNIVYGIVNNDSALYCMIRFNDQQLARMMAVRGFTLWVNESDDEKKLLGIHYRDENLREDLVKMFRSGSQRQQREQKDPSQQVIYPKGRFILAYNDSISDIDLNNIYGMNASAGLDGGLYCYEFNISIKESPKIAHYLDVTTGESIKIGMEIAAVSEEDQEKLKKEMEKNRESMGSGRGGGRGGGMRSGGGKAGGRGGGGMRGGGQQMPDMDGEEMWVTVKLAQD